MIVPNYYHKFSCIADKCRHTCCAGWEIDVDPDSLERYKDIPDISSHIKDGSYILEAEERCPFLRDDGLCRMILTYGEEMLCNICKDHPRFRNYMGGEEYMGLGLCCEEACRLILNETERFELVPPRPLPFFIDTVQDDPSPVSELLDGIYPDDISCAERAVEYLKFERLDDKWTTLLENLKSSPVEPADSAAFMDKNDKKFRNLIIYFLYRHPGNIFLACDATRLIADICVSSGESIEEIARMYSSEIEYSDENLQYFE